MHILKKFLKHFTGSQRTGVTHLYPNDCYYGHLSIYLFAMQFTKECKVLDAGSGMGYGSAYLAKNGSHYVVGLELSKRSVKFSRKYFKLPNLVYQQMDLQNIKGIEPHQFDIIFSSNVLEHIPDVTAFLRNVRKLIKPEGALIAAVPPITNNLELMANLSISDHLNIWSPRQWHHVLKQYFNKIECYTHTLDKPGITLNLDNKPAETRINEHDFSFQKVSIDELGYKEHSLTAIFLANEPVMEENFPHFEKQPFFVDHSFTRNSDTQTIKIKDGAALTDITYSTRTNLGPLFIGERYCQTFIAKNNNLMAISLFVATYCKQIDSMVELAILEPDKSEIRKIEINSKEFIDNTWQTFFFTPIPDSKGKKYIFCIETTGKNEAITLWTNKKVAGICKKNSKPVNFAICFRSYYQELPVNSVAPIPINT
jgi:2-polyprenyl-3-methyl-5-hydroxy-6-metoxy-1,4-benzoquinol methylase